MKNVQSTQPEKAMTTPVEPKKTSNKSYKKLSYKKKVHLVNMMVNKIRQDLTSDENKSQTK